LLAGVVFHLCVAPRIPFICFARSLANDCNSKNQSCICNW
jgi:hypothetical protein